MPSLMGTFVAYKFVKQLAKPWKEWDAYKLGIIDADGNTIKSPTTKKEKEAFDLPERLIRNVKKIIEKIPFGKSRLGSLAAALFLLKEESGLAGDDQEFDSEFLKNINIVNEILLEYEAESTILAGTYKDAEENFYVLSEDLEPFSECIGIPLYKIKNVVTRQCVVVSTDDLTKVK
jgi:hypothetical protein